MINYNQEYYSAPYYFFLRDMGDKVTLYYSVGGTINESRQSDKKIVFDKKDSPKINPNSKSDLSDRTIKNEEDEDIIPEWVPIDRCLEKVITTYDYEGILADELSFKENTIIYVIKKNNDNWYEGIMKNENGDKVVGK